QTADGQDGDLDGVRGLAHRSVLPVVIATLVAEPVLDVDRGFVDAALPVVLPALAHHGRILGASVVGPHRRRPGQHLVTDDGSAVVVAVVGRAVVGGADGADGGEFGWLPCGELQTVESAPRLPDDPALPLAPVLRGNPLEHLQSVVEFCLRVLVGHAPGRVAAAAKIDSDAGIAGAGELRVDGRVTACGHVVLAVGDVFEYRGNRLVV